MRLDQYLSENGINASWFAQKLGASRQALHRWRTGEGAPSSVMAVKIADLTRGAVTAHDFAEHQVERLREKEAA